jgi:hypothetical protein
LDEQPIAIDRLRLDEAAKKFRNISGAPSHLFTLDPLEIFQRI